MERREGLIPTQRSVIDKKAYTTYPRLIGIIDQSINPSTELIHNLSIGADYLLERILSLHPPLPLFANTCRELTSVLNGRFLSNPDHWEVCTQLSLAVNFAAR